MTFLDAERLWLLAVVVALAGLYVGLQRSRRRLRGAVHLTNLAVLRSVAPRRPAWRRHVPAVATALAAIALVVAFANPVRAVRVPKEAATVMLVVDVSASMDAVDVVPNRLRAAIAAATEFVDNLPPQIRVGLVAFDQFARVLSVPTTDHETVRAQIDGLTLGAGTAAGEALYAALDAIVAAQGTDPAGAAIVLLSDGATTIGRSPLTAADAARERGIPVSTIAFGTDAGSVFVLGREIAVPADPVTMAQVAELTSGTFFEADSGDELKGIYEDIGTTVGYEIEQRDNGGPILASGVVALMAALGLGLLWNGRLL